MTTQKPNNNDFESIVEEAIDNVRNDRDRTLSCLGEVQNWIKGGASERMRDGASSMAKLLEVVQKSNEQLVKIAALKVKDRTPEDLNLTDEERETLYEDIANKDEK